MIMERFVKSITLLVALFYAAPLFAQFDFAASNAVGAGLGGATTALEDAGSAMENVAGLSSQEGQWVMLSMRQQPGVTGMNQAALSLLSSLPFGGAGVEAVYYGDADYHEERLSAAYALPVGEQVTLGIAFHYLHSGTSDPYYEPLSRFTFSAALRYKPTRRLTIGFKAYNPIAVVSESDRAVRIPTLFNLGVGYRLLDEMLAVVEVEKNSYRAASLRVGLQYCFFDDYFARVGLATAPIVYTFGLGMQKLHLGGDVAVQIHNVLGLIPQLSLRYHF